ncbi:MAG: hypothetical protein ACYDGS_01385 [Thermoleophilia bacterium]
MSAEKEDRSAWYEKPFLVKMGNLLNITAEGQCSLDDDRHGHGGDDSDGHGGHGGHD